MQGKAASSKDLRFRSEARTDTNPFEAFRMTEEAEEEARQEDRKQEVKAQPFWEAERRVAFLSKEKNQDEMERRSLCLARENYMEATRSHGQTTQRRKESPTGIERKSEGRKRASAGADREARSQDEAKGPRLPDPLAACEGGDRGGSGGPLGRLVRVENRAVGPPTFSQGSQVVDSGPGPRQ
eukprot:12154195-Heterocapsa_arctica.AAC.1